MAEGQGQGPAPTGPSGYDNFLNYMSKYRDVYARLPKAAKKRGEGSLAKNLQRSKTPFLSHLHSTIKLINRGQLPIDPEVEGRMTVEDRFYLKKAGDNKRKCLQFLRHEKQGARTAALVGDIVNRALLCSAEDHTTGRPKRKPKHKAKPKQNPEPASTKEHEFDAAPPPVSPEYEAKLAEWQRREAQQQSEGGSEETGSM